MRAQGDGVTASLGDLVPEDTWGAPELDAGTPAPSPPLVAHPMSVSLALCCPGRPPGSPPPPCSLLFVKQSSVTLQAFRCCCMTLGMTRFTISLYSLQGIWCPPD